jgi:hypothetical protein
VLDNGNYKKVNVPLFLATYAYRRVRILVALVQKDALFWCLQICLAKAMESLWCLIRLWIFLPFETTTSISHTPSPAVRWAF